MADNEGETDKTPGMAAPRREGSGRNPREQRPGVSSVGPGREQACRKEEGLLLAAVGRDNMWKALRRVESNHGSAGIDGMAVEDLRPWLKSHWPEIRRKLLDGSYEPAAVRRKAIPKPDGGERILGIPTVLDRLIQQAIAQVLVPVFDPRFSENSYGYRTGRRAEQAVRQARDFQHQGRRWVVDLDLEKFFDHVNHDILMQCLRERVQDPLLLKLIGKYLRAGMMEGGVESPRHEGTPQGGPLSPLLSNILLDRFDKELEKRGHCFVRYADDCNIYVKSKAAGERTLASVTRWLAKRLKLKVNTAKSAVARPWERKLLGYSVTSHRKAKLRVAPASVERFKGKVKASMHRGRGRNLGRFIKEELNPILNGWAGYFKAAETKGIFEELDGWVRRRLRNILWRQWKRPPTRRRKLMELGLDPETAKASASNGRGPWWNSGASHMNRALPRKHFDRLGLVNLQDRVRFLEQIASW